MIDLAIVGAGAAGISAAREAKRRGLSALILEASDRIGGRARSLSWNGHALDLGAGWLHSAERNPLVALAEQLERPIDRAPTPWRGQYLGLGFSRDDQKKAYEAFEAFNAEVSKKWVDDIAAEALPAGGPWNVFIEALSGYLNGTSLKAMSAEDYAAYWDSSGPCNWRLPSGYGSLLAALGEGLEASLGFNVNLVEWDEKHLRLSSEKGSVAAKAVIITVSTNLLARGIIRFVPALDDHLHAAAELPLGIVEKMFFALKEPQEFPNDAHLIGNPHSSSTGSYMLRPMGIPIVEGFFGGEWVRGAGADDLEALAREELGALLGSAFIGKMGRIVQSNWKDSPSFGGSYSYARPRQHSARQALGVPVAHRLAFAGEACSQSDFSTVHGAWESGIAAVERLVGEDALIARS